MNRIQLLTVKDEMLFSDINVQIKNKVNSVLYYSDDLADQIDNTILLYTDTDKTLYLAKIKEVITPKAVNETHTKIDRTTVYGDHVSKIFYKFKVLEKFKLKRKIKFPEEDKIYFLDKPIHNKLYAELLSVTILSSDIYGYLSNEKEIDRGVLALKAKDGWGFLYYERQEDGEYEFIFEKINNFDGSEKLTQTEEGFRDFTYFITSHALPKGIKIGRAENPDQRLRQIQAHNARDVEIETLLADGRLESYYHSKFDHLRINSSREWFEVGEDIIEVMNKENAKINYIMKIFDRSDYKKQLFSK